MTFKIVSKPTPNVNICQLQVAEFTKLIASEPQRELGRAREVCWRKEAGRSWECLCFEKLAGSWLGRDGKQGIHG
ncbi:hypothetical protein K443DRAFT_680530 [Laccaria amethystina LaAM-08-1]|uniref:Uncharacterized protein n=1 Tax=Laccaria amethystina LaAM-08-1 TaxID=1095629 RepID=A0A0C9XMC5_9AGAR|nr:hypothetical protein K443DRAFT_680530 [Laccaria amethystina LaAM-08-1]